VGLVKPQSAFYERHGWRGFRTLERLIAESRDAGLLVILDVKRGDVGTTNDAYAEAFLGSGAPLAADAVTVHPYLGLAAMSAFVTRTDAAGSALLVVTRSSNPEGRAVQASRGPLGHSVEETLLREIGALNAHLAPGGIGPIGSVVGPTHVEPALDLAAMNGLFLAPGVGAQGATAADVASVFAATSAAVAPWAPTPAGPDVGRLRDIAARLRPPSSAPPWPHRPSRTDPPQSPRPVAGRVRACRVVADGQRPGPDGVGAPRPLG